MAPEDDWDEWYDWGEVDEDDQEQDRRRDTVEVDETPGRGFLYRPGQLLVADEDVGMVSAELERRGAYDSERKYALGLVRFFFLDNVDLPGLVAELRSASTDRMPRVSLNHVFYGQGFPPRAGVHTLEPAEALSPLPRRPGLPGEGARVGILDTGMASHPYLESHYAADLKDYDTLDQTDDGKLANQAGHGTLIAGAVLQRAPGARLYVRRVLDGAGAGDDLALALTMLQLPPDIDIVLLALGGYSHEDAAPLALSRAVTVLARNSAGAVVIAAAGNAGSVRPFWPAALKRVIGVGALDDDGVRASFSNYGWWVDGWALGTDVTSTYVQWDGPTTRHEQVRFGGWARASGTSLAAAQVSGVIATTVARLGIDAREAAFRLTGAARVPRLPDGSVVVPVEDDGPSV